MELSFLRASYINEYYFISWFSNIEDRSISYFTNDINSTCRLPTKFVVCWSVDRSANMCEPGMNRCDKFSIIM